MLWNQTTKKVWPLWPKLCFVQQNFLNRMVSTERSKPSNPSMPRDFLKYGAVKKSSPTSHALTSLIPSHQGWRTHIHYGPKPQSGTKLRHSPCSICLHEHSVGRRGQGVRLWWAQETGRQNLVLITFYVLGLFRLVPGQIWQWPCVFLHWPGPTHDSRWNYFILIMSVGQL